MLLLFQTNEQLIQQFLSTSLILSGEFISFFFFFLNLKTLVKKRRTWGLEAISFGER